MKRSKVLLLVLVLFLSVNFSIAQESASNFSQLPVTISGGKVDFAPASVISTNVPVVAGWNIISVPVNAVNMTFTTLFPTAATQAFGFNNGYVVSASAQVGNGYFIRFDNAATVPITGDIVALRQFPVVAGWNIIGPFETPVSVTSITSNPPGIIATQFFGFVNGYVQVSTLEVGKGYWVRVTQAGTLILP